MRVVLHSKTEVPGCGFARALQNVFTRTDELDDGQGDVGKVLGIGSFSAQQEIVQSNNHTTVYIPVGPMGVPIVGNLNVGPAATPEPEPAK